MAFISTLRASIADKDWKFAAAAIAAPIMILGGMWMYSSTKSSRASRPKARADQLTALNSPEKQEAEVEFDYATTSDNQGSTEEQVARSFATLSEEDRNAAAEAAKSVGNKFYSAKDFEKAIEKYSSALAYFDPSDSRCAVFFCNRAACFMHLEKYENVVEDSSKALECDPIYTKALMRRGLAYENLHQLRNSLRDFRNNTATEAADRVLRKLATEFANVRTAQNQDFGLPSSQFVATFMSSFQFDYQTQIDRSDKNSFSGGDHLFIEAVACCKKLDWQKAFENVSASVSIGGGVFLSQAFNLHATFLYLMGKTELSIENLEKSIELDPKNVNSYVKMGLVLTEVGNTDILLWFEKALSIAPADPDIYYHRGQVYFLQQDFNSARENYRKAMELDPSFLLAHIQCAVADYKLGNTAAATRAFESLEERFPDRYEPSFYYGEILLDAQKVQEAMEKFDKSSKISPDMALPYLNKSIVLFHMLGDIVSAKELTEKAINSDPKSELAFMHLANILTQLNQYESALEAYDKAIKCARTQAEIENLYIGRETCQAQYEAIKYLSSSPKGLTKLEAIGKFVNK